MQDPYPATFQRRHHNISLGAVFFCLHVNNNLSKYNFNLGDTTANNHKNIDRIATFSGGTWINKDYNADFGGQWCFVDSFLIDGNGAAIQRIMSAQTNTVLATRYCEKNVWGGWNIGVTKSDLNSALIYRGDITGDLNRASKNGITPGYYTVGNSSTISNGPKGIAWCTFIQFYDNFHTQMIIDTTGLFVRKFAGNPVEWIDWVQYSKS